MASNPVLQMPRSILSFATEVEAKYKGTLYSQMEPPFALQYLAKPPTLEWNWSSIQNFQARDYGGHCFPHEDAENNSPFGPNTLHQCAVKGRVGRLHFDECALIVDDLERPQSIEMRWMPCTIPNLKWRYSNRIWQSNTTIYDSISLVTTKH